MSPDRGDLSFVEAATAYVENGWRVFPLKFASKEPAIPNGFHDATSDPEHVEHLWRGYPSANIGLVIPDHLVVIDVDPRHGGSVEALEAIAPIPRTLTSFSGRGDGGRHLWFLHPGGALSAKRLPAGVDLKAGGRGYVVAPPSVHPEGGAYWWQDESADVAAMPEPLVARLRPRIPKVSRPVRLAGRAGSAYATAALHGEVRAVAAAVQGTRNDQLNRSAYSLGQLVGAAALARQVVEDALYDAARTAGLEHDETLATIESGLDAGVENPRQVAS